MKKTNRKGPDRIILFEVGIIIALLAVNYVLEMGYNTSFVIPPEKEDVFFDSAYTYREIENEPIVQEETPKVEKIEAVMFNPIATIKFVQKLFDIQDIVIPSPSNAIPKPMPYIPTNPIVDSSFIMDDIADVMPQFPGGPEELGKYIRDNYRITDQMFDYAKEVYLVMQFVVNKNGEISDIQILSCSHPGLGAEQEARRLYSSMPKWQPAEHRGRPANIRLKQPIKIQIY